MLKKIFYIITATLLLVGTTGVILTEHFCHNQRVEISINKTIRNCCGKTCKHCHTVSHYVKIADQFTLTHFHFYKIKFSHTLLSFITSHSVLPQTFFVNERVSYSSSSPPRFQNKLYSFFLNFRL